MSDGFQDRVVITGAGSGIGAACVRRLARPGRRLALLGRRREPLDLVADQARDAGAEVISVTCDVRDGESIDRAVGRVVESFSGIDVLVNAAGIAGGGVTCDEADSHWDDVLLTNLSGSFRMSREVLRRGGMLERQWGRIINIASTGGKQGVVYAAAYSASKHGVVGLTKSLGLELARTGVTVNAVCPGFVETEMAVHARCAYAAIHGVTPEEMGRRIEARVPIGRYINPDEVASVVAYLASAETSAITAQAWNVCGGLGNY